MGYGVIFKLGIPIALAASSSVALDQINLFVTAGSSSAEIAAVSFTSGLVMIFYLITRGFGAAQSLLVSRQRAHKRLDLAYQYFLSGLILRLGVSSSAGILIYFFASRLEILGLPADVAEVSRRVSPFFSLGAFFCLTSSIFRDLWESFEEAKFPMFAIFLGLFLNGVVAYLFSRNVSGLEHSAAFACGVGFLVGQWVTLVILVWRTEMKHQFFRRGHSLPEFHQIWEVFKSGAPISFQQFCECAAFVTTAIFIGNIGTDDLAARQVANSVVNTTFLVPLGLAQASMILVGMQRAKNDVLGALSLGRAALVSTALLMAGFGLAIYFLRSQIPSLYGLSPAASHLATSMLIIAAVFQIADGLQVVTAGILRGHGDIKVPAYLIILAWWGVAIPMEWLLGFYFKGGSLGVWTGLACGVGCCALLLGLRLNWLTRQIKNPS